MSDTGKKMTATGGVPTAWRRCALKTIVEQTTDR